MKKLLTYLMITLCLSITSMNFVSANETTVYENKWAEEANSPPSGMIPESEEEYNSSERIQERKLKMLQLENNKNSSQSKVSKYTISLPLRGQQNSYYCAPAAGEMIIDYQLGPNNIYTQDKIANAMGTTTSGTKGAGVARGLKAITGLNFTYQSLSEVPLLTALKTDINAYVGLVLPVEAGRLYSGFSGGHALAAKGYSNSTVIYLDPWKYNPNIYGEHEVALSKMEYAIKGFENKIVW